MNPHKMEADLEARMHAVLKSAFPWLPAHAIKHQTQFTVKLGHTAITIGSKNSRHARGRSDILVQVNDQPLAIVELKRENLSLSNDDVAQGLSYARLTSPMTPLVIVSNGTAMRIHITYSGEEWNPVDRTERDLERRLKQVGDLAASGVTDAVHILMASNQQHWVPAFKAISRTLVDERSGAWHEPLAPFVRGFLVPRRASAIVIHALKKGARAVVLHGPPLSGKSNVLRQLIDRTESSDSIAVLLLEPGEGGIFRALSHLLSSELNWSVSHDHAREWIRQVSNDDITTLILALDGVDSTSSEVLADLNELASDRFGAALRVLVTVDDSAMENITKKRNGREASSFGRIAEEIPLLPLDDGEFDHARKELARNRISVTRGGESVRSLREPWILRALVPPDLTSLPQDRPNLNVRIPPLLDIQALHCAADAFPLDGDAKMLIRASARAILDQYLESRNSRALLQGISTFAVKKDLLENALGAPGLGALRQRGFIKPGIDWSERPVWFFRVPALVATHVAVLLAERISDWQDPDEAAKQLISIAARLPFGDVIAADALVQRVASRTGDNILELLSALLRIVPSKSSLSPGSRVALVVSDQLVHATMTKAGKLALANGPESIEIDLGEDDLKDALTDPGGWLILSHVASVPLGLIEPGAPEPLRIDEPLLLEVGQAAVLLSQMDGAQGFKEVTVHELPEHGTFVCHQSGIVEPITWALVKYFLQGGGGADAWVDEALGKQSLPLLTRVHIALGNVAEVADARGSWARETLDNRISPALRQFPMHH